MRPSDCSRAAVPLDGGRGCRCPAAWPWPWLWLWRRYTSRGTVAGSTPSLTPRGLDVPRDPGPADSVRPAEEAPSRVPVRDHGMDWAVRGRNACLEAVRAASRRRRRSSVAREGGGAVGGWA